MTGVGIIRSILAIIGVLMLLGGIAAGTVGGVLPLGLYMIVSGTVLLIIVAIETMRYRSEAAEANRTTPGPGGGETGPPEGRFKPTDEVFVDPTSQRRMRVYTDGRTGERRYVAEG
jgi:hypothetical protein